MTDRNRAVKLAVEIHRLVGTGRSDIFDRRVGENVRSGVSALEGEQVGEWFQSRSRDRGVQAPLSWPAREEKKEREPDNARTSPVEFSITTTAA